MGQLIRCSDVRLINHRIRTVRMRMRAVDAISITFTPGGHSRNRRPLPVRAVMSALGLPRAWAEVYAIRHVFPSGHVAMRNRYRTIRRSRAGWWLRDYAPGGLYSRSRCGTALSTHCPRWRLVLLPKILICPPHNLYPIRKLYAHMCVSGDKNHFEENLHHTLSEQRTTWLPRDEIWL